MTRCTILPRLSALLCLAGCGPAPTTTIATTTATTAPPDPVIPAADPFDLDAWIAELERTGAPGLERLEPATATELDARLADVVAKFGQGVRRDESQDDPCAGAPAAFGGVRRIDGQMDADSELETAVVVLRAVTERSGEAERCEDTWIGLFDRSAAGFRLVLTSHRNAYHCLFDDRETAVTVGFTEGEAGSGPAFSIERQQVDACGTLVDYRYQVFHVRLGRDGPTIERQPESESVTYDRVEGVEESRGPEEVEQSRSPDVEE